jgi:mRNA interferase RelE/StbE
MPAYKVILAPKAEEQLDALQKTEAKRVAAGFLRLGAAPRPQKAEKISGHPPFRRIRVGDYRVIYAVDDESRIVVIVRVRHRRDAYRDLDKLDPRLIAETLGSYVERPQEP